MGCAIRTGSKPSDGFKALFNEGFLLLCSVPFTVGCDVSTSLGPDGGRSKPSTAMLGIVLFLFGVGVMTPYISSRGLSALVRASVSFQQPILRSL